MAYTITGKATTGLGNISISGANTSVTLPWNGTSASTWTTASLGTPYVSVGTASNSALKVSGDADIQGNLTVNGTNISAVLAKIQDRLAILTPDPRLLAKYEALREAYEHYKTLEALCVDSDSQTG